jgi:hypothetical protein
VTEGSSPGLVSSPEIDTSVSHSARVWDYWLGGKENYPVDREVGDRIAAMFPDIVEPGVVSCTRWRPETTLNGVPDEMDLFVAVGQKP